MRLSEPFIRRPIATTLLMAAVAFIGIAAFPFLPVAPLPQVDFPTIQVSATWQGASAETMATSVAAPLERQFAQIPGISQMTSLSALGATTIVIQFDLNRNIDSAAQDVQAAITVAGKQLPQSMTAPPSYKKVNPADSPILLLALRSDTIPLTKVDDYADLFLAQQISQVAGVAQVSIFGDRTPSIRIQLDPAKLANAGLTLEDVRPALISATTNVAKGTINTDKTSFTIATNDQITEAGPFNDVILAYRNGAPIRVSDVGQAVSAAVDRNVAAYQNNKDGIILAVFKQPGANVVETVDKIKAELPQLTDRIPPAVKVQILLDKTTTIRASVADVEFTLALTIGLVVLVILLFLRSFWATLIPSVTVPLALLGSAAVMYVLGFSLDNLSLMALTIAVGFVVDDAIVVVENIYRHIEEGASPMEAAIKGSGEIGFTVLSISLSLIAVFIPLLLMGGIMSLTLAPMMCARFMTRQPDTHGRVYLAIEAAFNGMLTFYRRTLDIVLRHQRITIAVFFATLALTAVMAIIIPKGFFPIQDTGLISAFVESGQEASPPEMMRLMKQIGGIIGQDSDVAGFATFTGSTGSAQTANTARGFIVLKPRDERTLTASQIIDRLRPQLAKIEGVNVFLQPSQDITVGGRIARAS
ncbi:MAG: efflux RND transporter permease subunit, partial [Rhizobiales bacterium]|nr:efflux RND transporter permease subunit [Hyphomicrobiales bacterium]